jgi:integrase
MKLTRDVVAALTPGAKDVLFWDDELAGFGVRVATSGRKTWLCQYRVGGRAGQQRRVSLGLTSVVSADAARRKAKELLAQARLGVDTVGNRRAEQERVRHTLGTVVDAYLAHAETRLRPRTLTETKRHLKTHWKPLLKLPIDDLHRRDVAQRLSVLVKQSGPVASNRARSALSACLSWAMREGQCESNPTSHTHKQDEKARSRVLGITELVSIWRACGDDDYGAIVKLLILTGARRNEIGGMRWFDLAGSEWTISGSRTKPGRTLWLPQLAIELLPTRHDDRDAVFGRLGTGFSGWSRCKRRLDAKLPDDMPAWALHDLRRSFSTHTNEAGEDPDVVEEVLGHQQRRQRRVVAAIVGSGGPRDVEAVYNRAKHATAAKAVLERWAASISTALVVPQEV